MQHRVGWWHADGRMGVLFLRFLHGIGVPATNPVAAVPVAGSAAEVASSASNPAPWRLLVAIGALALMLIGGAAMARPRSPAHPA
jgi:hypothetical protein